MEGERERETDGGGGEFRFCPSVFDGSVTTTHFKHLVLMVTDFEKQMGFFNGLRDSLELWQSVQKILQTVKFLQG